MEKGSIRTLENGRNNIRILHSFRRDKVKLIQNIIKNIQQEYDNGYAPYSDVINLMVKVGIDEKETADLIKKLKRDGSIFEPKFGYFRTT